MPSRKAALSCCSNSGERWWWEVIRFEFYFEDRDKLCWKVGYWVDRDWFWPEKLSEFRLLCDEGSVKGSFLFFIFWCLAGSNGRYGVGGNQPFNFGHDKFEMPITHPSGVVFMGEEGWIRRSFVLSQIFIENLPCARSYSRSYSRLWRSLWEYPQSSLWPHLLVVRKVINKSAIKRNNVCKVFSSPDGAQCTIAIVVFNIWNIVSSRKWGWNGSAA